MKKQLLIIGGGFASFWSAVSSIRQSRDIQKRNNIEITLINPDNYFTLRPRLYDISLEDFRIELDKYFKQLGIQQIIGKTEIFHPGKNEVLISTAQGVKNLSYDYLILASDIDQPDMERTHNIYVFNNNQRLKEHLMALVKNDFSQEDTSTFLVAGAGFAGLEAVFGSEEKTKTVPAYSDRKAHLKKASFRCPNLRTKLTTEKKAK